MRKNSLNRCLVSTLVNRQFSISFASELTSGKWVYYLTSAELKGRRNRLRIMMNEKRKSEYDEKRSRKSERTLNSCMHGDDRGME